MEKQKQTMLYGIGVRGGEFGQTWARFKIFLLGTFVMYVYLKLDFFKLKMIFYKVWYWIFWAMILFFLGKIGQPPHEQVGRYAYGFDLVCHGMMAFQCRSVV